MHLYRTPSLGAVDWGSLISTGIQAGTTLAAKSIDKSIARQQAGIQAQQIALENKRQEIELIKLRNQNLLAQRQMEAATAQASPLSVAGRTLSAPIDIPGIGKIPLTYVLIPAGIVLAVLLMRKRK